MSCRLIVLAKAPQAGLAKTRLIPALGADAAARLARRMLEDRMHQALRAGFAEIELCVTPGPSHPAWQALALPRMILWSDQGPGDLGERMARAAGRGLQARGRVVLVGSDCPALNAQGMREAVALLDRHDAVMVPALDGGYVLLGLRRFDAALFSAIPWGGAEVAAITRQRCADLGWALATLPPLPDIDLPGDLAHLPESWRHDVQ